MQPRFVILSIIIALIAIPYLAHKTEAPSRTMYLSAHFKSLEDAQKTFTQQKPLFLWDLHNVLFYKPALSLFTRGLWNIENKPKFAFQFLKALLQSNVREKLLYLTNAYCLTSQAYFDTVQEYKHLHKQLITLSNNIYIPNKPLLKILTTLQEDGYSHYLFSNIGPETLKELQRMYPQYFMTFEQKENTINTLKPDHMHWTWKPQTKAYTKVLDHVNATHQPWMTIFIDDKLENIKKAQEMGINGILFISIEQTEQDINQLININERL